MYKQVRAQWKRQGSVLAIQDFLPRHRPHALSNKLMEARNSSKWSTDVKGKHRDQFCKDTTKKEAKLLRVGALRKGTRCQKVAFLASIEKDYDVLDFRLANSIPKILLCNLNLN